MQVLCESYSVQHRSIANTCSIADSIANIIDNFSPRRETRIMAPHGEVLTSDRIRGRNTHKKKTLAKVRTSKKTRCKKLGPPIRPEFEGFKSTQAVEI